MKYYVISSNREEIHVSTISLVEAQTMADKREDWSKYSMCMLKFTPQNKEEMMQHARKIADYFEQVDTAKEAVIRCTKI